MAELQNVRFLLTREPERSARWARTIENRGGVPVIVPLIRTQPVRRRVRMAALETAGRLAGAKTPVVVGLASAHAAEYWSRFMAELAAPLQVVQTFALGAATAEKARELGFEVSTAETPNATGLAKVIGDQSEAQAEVILPRARHGRDEGIDLLKQKGRKVHALDIYETVPVRAPEVSDPEPVSWVISASPSAARAYAWHRAALVRAGVVALNTHHAAIGASTAEAAIAQGLKLQVVAREPTIDSVLDSIAAGPPVVVA